MSSQLNMSHSLHPSFTEQGCNFSLLPPSFNSDPFATGTASHPSANQIDTSSVSDDLSFSPSDLADSSNHGSSNSLDTTPPPSPSTSTCSLSSLSDNSSATSTAAPSKLGTKNNKMATVTASRPPRIKPQPMRQSITKQFVQGRDTGVSPVTAAFQMQCASKARNTMADVKFGLLTPNPPPSMNRLPAWRPLEQMTDEELQMRLAQANSEEEVEEKKDPNDPEAHVRIWNRRERRKIAGNAAPLRRNVAAYLRTRPDCEVYNYQDKPAGWKPKKKIAKRKRVANLLMMEIQRRDEMRREERGRMGGRSGNADGCGVCWGEEVNTRGRYCGDYRCRMKRHRIDGKLDESLKGSVGAPMDGVCCEFEMTESCMSDVTGGEVVELVFKGEEVSGWMAGGQGYEDELQTRALPRLSGEFEDCVDSIV